MIYAVESSIYVNFVAHGAKAEDRKAKKLDNAGAKREALEWR